MKKVISTLSICVFFASMFLVPSDNAPLYVNIIWLCVVAGSLLTHYKCRDSKA